MFWITCFTNWRRKCEIWQKKGMCYWILYLLIFDTESLNATNHYFSGLILCYRPWVHKFSTNLGSTSKLQAAAGWHAASFILRTSKRWTPLYKSNLPGQPGSWVLCVPSVDSVYCWKLSTSFLAVFVHMSVTFIILLYDIVLGICL